jgi:hypothetical protein
MAKISRASRKPIYSILALSLFISIAYAGYKYMMPEPESAGIFLVAPTELEYGNTTITGLLTKDASDGKAGTFIVVLPDSRPVTLDAPGLDSMVGSTVEVAGLLIPGDSMFPMKMFVESIKAK